MFNYQVAEYRERNGILIPMCYVDGVLKEVAWAPLPGSQRAFLQCPDFEALYEGTRGVGKSVALLMDYAQFVGIGLGAAHSGLIVRCQYPELEHIIRLSRIWFPRFFPGCSYNGNDHLWNFSWGETLKFGFIEHEDQFDQLHQGKEYNFIGMEELQNWPTPECLRLMTSLLRSTNTKAPKHLRSTCNTFGVGSEWIMERYRLPLQPFDRTVGPAILDGVDDNGRPEEPRRVIHGHINENLPMLYADPNYLSRTLASTENAAKSLAWATGQWTRDPDSVFHDIDWQWAILPSFKVTRPEKIRIAYDFGDSAPFSVLFIYEGNGEDIELPDGRTHHAPPGSLYVVDEIYGGIKNRGLNLTIAEQAERIKSRINERGWDMSILKREGNVADASIFDDRAQLHERSSYAKDFAKCGVRFEASDKSAGSRVQGLGQARKMFRACTPPREFPGLYITDNCHQLLNHLPKLQRSKSDPEDCSTVGVDHDWDSLRYYLRREFKPTVRFGRVEQLYPHARGRIAVH